MNRLIFLITLVLSTISCNQNTKSKNLTKEKTSKSMYDINQYIFPEAKNITESKYIEKLNSQIKHFKEEPIYYLRTNKQNCLIEVYVNDIREFRDYKISNYITPIEISNVLKSGSQKITVKMYPVGNLNNESWGKKNESPMTELSENSSVEISVVKIDEKSSKGFDDEKLITKQVSPKDIAGKEMYEFSFTFDAQVPYEFEGWTKGQDLRKLDQDLVQKKALDFYEMAGNLILNKDLDSWLKLNYLSDVRIMSSTFVNNEYLYELLNEYKDNVTKYDYKMENIKDFKMVYMGDGKLLRLNQTSLDDRYRGKGALILKYGKTGEYFPGITLFLPEGRDLTTQGFMMWK